MDVAFSGGGVVTRALLLAWRPMHAPLSGHQRLFEEDLRNISNQQSVIKDRSEKTENKTRNAHGPGWGSDVM